MPQKHLIMNSPCFTRFSIFFCCVFTMATVIFKDSSKTSAKNCFVNAYARCKQFPLYHASIVGNMPQTLAGRSHSLLWTGKSRETALGGPWSERAPSWPPCKVSFKGFQTLKNSSILPPVCQSCCAILHSHQLHMYECSVSLLPLQHVGVFSIFFFLVVSLFYLFNMFSITNFYLKC